MPAKRSGRTIVLFLALALASAQQTFAPTPDVYRALERISAASLRGNLSFIASELLEGRDTPSRGLDIAAVYIAAQFRAAGLEPVGDDGYFQTAKMLRVLPAPDGFELRMQDGSRTLVMDKSRASVLSRYPLELSGAPVYIVRELADVKAGDAKGKVVMLAASRGNRREVARAATALQPAAFLETADDADLHGSRLSDLYEEDTYGGVPRLIVRDAEAKRTLRAAKAGETGLTISVKLPVPTLIPVTVRNVIGLLRGSDPVLRDQYILLTAHYDHLGMDGPGRVFQGANDDGSGTVSVMEIGKALAAMPVHPKRSIVFMTFFGEEEGSLGSLYYARHPAVPLEKTVADLNLEQVGRTDSSVGPEVSNASLTGFEYSNIAHVLQQAGKLTGVKVYEAPNGDEFFNRSDNQTFAERGIPAHTIVVAFEYPDYHAVGDVWQKIDYDNMAKVDRMIALGSIMLADSADAPQWNRKNAKAARYLNAR
jgi:Zn-dependent M28 family amino/carboxypeptidase